MFTSSCHIRSLEEDWILAGASRIPEGVFVVGLEVVREMKYGEEEWRSEDSRVWPERIPLRDLL